MMPAEQLNKKMCPYCAESIPARAKLCPRCRQWLSYRSFRNPVFTFCLVILPLIYFWILMANWFGRVTNPRPFYSELPASLHVLESRMNWAETSDGLRVFVTGTITNESKVAWKSVEFDLRFYDQRGRLIDAATQHGAFTIGPGNDSAFRVYIKPLLSSNEYNSFKISVGDARNARGFW